jgi:hypothetical protein
MVKSHRNMDTHTHTGTDAGTFTPKVALGRDILVLTLRKHLRIACFKLINHLKGGELLMDEEGV